MILTFVLAASFPFQPWAYRVGGGGAGGGGGRQPPQFVGQTKPVGQYLLYSRAILAYY